MKTDVVVVGGGIAGLAAAYWLQKGRIETVLLERDNRLGGKLRTEHADGFTLEAGPDSFLTTKPGAIELARELGMERDLQAPLARGALVMRDGRLYPLPEGLSGLVPARLGPLLRSPVLS
ncbi:MAG TPA: FAD-dependent oxidoreductase, partial [Acidobacteriaceae bacterium]|nr:FAD-dependent oxidoreductase [Acidobacteriaceae bacterium]